MTVRCICLSYIVLLTLTTFPLCLLFIYQQCLYFTVDSFIFLVTNLLGLRNSIFTDFIFVVLHKSAFKAIYDLSLVHSWTSYLVVDIYPSTPLKFKIMNPYYILFAYTIRKRSTVRSSSIMSVLQGPTKMCLGAPWWRKSAWRKQKAPGEKN